MRLQRPKRPQEAINHVASQRANGKPAEVAVSPPEVVSSSPFVARDGGGADLAATLLKYK
jgi:hypothetical protein